MSLRVCVATFNNLFDVSGDEQKIKGSLSPAYRFLVDSLWHAFPNASLMSSNKLGDMDSGTMMFDGCLGRLQRNESDLMIQVVPFPVLGNGMIHSKNWGGVKNCYVQYLQQHCCSYRHGRDGRFQVDFSSTLVTHHPNSSNPDRRRFHDLSIEVSFAPEIANER